VEDERPPAEPERHEEEEPTGLGTRLDESFQPALWTKLIVIGAVVVYGILFIAFNTESTKISFVFTSTRVSLIFLILLAVALGLVLGVLMSQLHRHRHRRR
jgi:uncharacterized integral membrane protein